MKKKNKSMIVYQDYCVADPDALETPAMLLFQNIMDHNIRRACEMAGGGQNLIVHVKTHKSEAVARKEIEAGIEGFKCATLAELAMVLQAGARRAILSFPQCQERKIDRLCDLTSSYPDTWIATIVSTPYHLEVLDSVATRRKQPLRVMLDLDSGQHRTGSALGQDAAKLYGKICAHEFLKPSGFHLYDGHQEFSDVIQRKAAALQHIDSLQEIQRQFELAGMPVPCVVAGGSFSFPYFAHTKGIYGSPGTFIYWDAGYVAKMPDMPFRCAALVLTQVVDRFPGTGTITTDLGSKTICTDPPFEKRVQLLGHDEAKLLQHDEEHGIFQIPGKLPHVGDYMLAMPGHVCNVTIRYPGIHVLDTSGKVVDYYLHTPRDRL